MYDNKNQSDGAIYTNNYKQNDKQPDWTGKVEISRDMLKELVSIVKEGGTGELRVALWNRTSKNGNEYKYARLDIPQKKEEIKAKMGSSLTQTEAEQKLLRGMMKGGAEQMKGAAKLELDKRMQEDAFERKKSLQDFKNSLDKKKENE